MIEMIYTVDGVTQRYTFADDKLDELLTRADARFCNATERADEALRYQRAIEHQRRTGARR